MPELYIDLCEVETKGILNQNLPDPDILDFFNRRANREIFLNNEVDDYCVEYAKQIFEWNKQDKGIEVFNRKKIKVFINTDGGDTTAMNALISAIQLSKTPVITIGLGKCFSAGAMILIAAKERFILPNTIVMIHKGSSGIASDVNKIIDYSKFLEKDNELCKEYIFANTNISENKYKEVENKDWYVFADECVEWGIATKIITDIDDIF
jgi:ATP-dependent Clp protease protease subunit